MATATLATVAALEVIQFGKYPIAAFFVVMDALNRAHTFASAWREFCNSADAFQIL